MTFQEFPKMIYHPSQEGVHVIVRSAEEEQAQLSEWGVAPAEEPKLTLKGGAKAKANS